MPGIKKVLATLVRLEDKLEKFEKRLETLEEKMQPATCNNVTTDSIREVVREEKREEEELEARKLNIVVHNIPESKRNQTAEKKQDDEKTLVDIVHETLKVEVEMGGIVRLGRLKDNNSSDQQITKSRPIRFSVKDFDSKRKILSATRVLKDHPSFSGIYFTPDLTQAQRLDGFKLREEKRRREKNGERNLIIRRNKIIQYKDNQNADHSYGQQQREEVRSQASGVTEGRGSRPTSPSTSGRVEGGGGRNTFR